jgi:hypothetical protein
VRKIDQSGDITTIAGTGEAGFNGDGQATSARINPVEVATAESGEIFVVDDHRVRMIRRNGTITTIAGTGTVGYSGDGGQASGAQLNNPFGIAVDKDKNVYIADRSNNRVRKVRLTDRMISTVAGIGTAGYSGDGHRATQAQLAGPTGLALDAAGNLYIADMGNHRIRMVDRTGKINTIVGTGVAGYNGDGQATSTQLNTPYGIAVDFAGNLFIADTGNHRIRKVIPSGKVFTVAGNGIPGYGGDDDEATAAQLNNPIMVGVDSKGNVYVADQSNHRIRKIIGIGGTPSKPKKRQHAEVVIKKADLVVKGFVNPRAVYQGSSVRVGVYLHNQASTEVRGEDVTVTVTLPEGFVSTDGTGQRCTRTFPGQTLVAGGPPLDGTFVAIAPRGVRDTTCEAVAEVSYSDELDATDYTVAVPFSLVKPSAPADERALTVSQAMVPQARAGQEATAIVELTATRTNQPVNPGTIRQEFSAPANFAFTGAASYAYYLDDGGVRSDPLEIDIADDGRRLIVNGNPHLNTDQTDTGTLAYVFTVRAEPTAEANEYTDGQAVIGHNDPVPLTGEVLAN